MLAIGKSLGLFYADVRVVGSRDPEEIQGALNVLIGLFRQYRLVVNVAKSKAMTCHPGNGGEGGDEDRGNGAGSGYAVHVSRAVGIVIWE